MRVNSVYGSVLRDDGHHVVCDLFVGPLRVEVNLPREKFIEKPYSGMPISLTIGHGETVVVLQIRKANAKPFEIMKEQIETALQALENKHEHR